MKADSSTLCTRFSAFVEQAKSICDSGATSAGATARAEFEEFATLAGNLLYRDARKYVEWLSSAIVPLEPSLSTHDILAVAGLTGDENTYTELIAWALWPTGHKDLAERCQRAWLQDVARLQVSAPVQPRTQFSTDDGIPDMVLPYPECPVVVEAKTGSVEHQTPSGLMQTVAYPSAVRRALALSDDVPSHMIFLTTDRALPANAGAHAVSYLETALAVANVIEHATLPEGLLAAYRVVLGHLATQAVPADFAINDVLAAVRNWRAADRNQDTSVIGPFVTALTRCERLLPARKPS